MAFKKECSAFDHTIGAVQTATVNDVNVGELLATMTAQGNVEATWNKLQRTIQAVRNLGCSNFALTAEKRGI
jgi:hypothetical protein